MIADFVNLDESLLWSEDYDRAIPEGANLAEFVDVLPQTLRAVSKKLWAIYALLRGVESRDDWEDDNSLDACQALAADAGRDCEVLIGDFERWLSDPKIMAVRLEEALGQAGTPEDAPERAAASDQRARLYIGEIADMLRTAPLAYVLALRYSIADSLKELRVEDGKARELVKSRSDDSDATAAAAKAADINAITLLLRRAAPGFVSALRSDLADPNARWSKYLAEAKVAEGDEAGVEGDRLASVVGQPGGTHSETTTQPSVDDHSAEDKVAVGV